MRHCSPAGSAARAQVILETKVDALDITVLKGGGDRGRELGPRARVLPAAGRARGARLLRRAESDLPRGPLQRRARREPRRADGQGTPVHIVIPTPTRGSLSGSWRSAARPPRSCRRTSTCSPIDGRRRFPRPSARRFDQSQRGLIQEVSEPASTTLLADLRSDRGMKWLPASDMWLTYIRVNETAGNLSTTWRSTPAATGGRALSRPATRSHGCRAVVGRLDRDGRARRGRRPHGDHGSGRGPRGCSVGEAAGGRRGRAALLVGAAAASRGAAARAPTGRSASRSTTRRSNRPISPSSPARPSAS